MGKIKILTKNWDKIDPSSLTSYKKFGGYKSLYKALRMKPLEVVDEVKRSGIRGRGGAGFLTGKKWEIATSQECKKRYFICNLDESEPGTYKDRLLAEKNPHQIIEGLVISAYAVGAKKAYIYINGNFAIAQFRLKEAIRQAYEHHFLGKSVMGSAFDLELELFIGAGAYICGEETALINSIQGKRGEPRHRPPFACACGLNELPTVVNNSETISSIPWIVKYGGKRYSEIGSSNNPGTKLFCIDGSVKRSGVYEVETGVSARDLVFDCAGGLKSGSEYYFSQIGGSSGSLVPMGLWDEELSYGNDSKVNMGSGAVLVIDKNHNIKQLALSWARFFQRESCGKCVPCREGTFRLKEILERLVNGDFNENDKKDLEEIIFVLDYTTFCALGKFSVNALKDVIKYKFISELSNVKIKKLKPFKS